MRDLLTAGLTALDLDPAAADKLARYAELLLEKKQGDEPHGHHRAPGRCHPAPAGLRGAGGAAGPVRQARHRRRHRRRLSRHGAGDLDAGRPLHAAGQSGQAGGLPEGGPDGPGVEKCDLRSRPGGGIRRAAPGAVRSGGLPCRGSVERTVRADAAAGKGRRTVRRHEIRLHRRGDTSGPQRHRPAGGQLSGVTDYTVPETDVVHRIVSIEKTQHTPKQFPRAFARIKKAPLV